LVGVASVEAALAESVAAASAFLLLRDFLVVVVGVSDAAAVGSAVALASVLAFFFFFLVVVVEVWSSGEAAWGLARAEIPVSTKNMQSVIVHVPSLVCSLLMDFLFPPDWP
jgi:hypothetical protein